MRAPKHLRHLIAQQRPILRREELISPFSQQWWVMQQLYAQVSRGPGCLRGFGNSSHFSQAEGSAEQRVEQHTINLLDLYIWFYDHLLSRLSQGSSAHGWEFVYEHGNGF